MNAFEQLILVRHGETVHNVAGIAQGWNDSELSARGREQARAAAARLRTMQPDALYSSPLGRALSTANVIGEALGLEVQVIDELREMSYGRWEGQSFIDVRKADEPIYRQWMDDGDCPCPDGESHNDLRRRLERAFAQITANRPVIVTHGTAIRVAATIMMNLPVMASRHFAQDNAAINVFARRNERIVLKLWNDVGHWREG